MTLSIIIPVFNEEKTIQEIIKRTSKVYLPLAKEIIVVDDCSQDNTLEALQKLEGRFDFILMKHSRNQGKGAAIKTGLSRAKGDFVIIQDADLEYNPEDYPALLSPLLKGEADVVYGSRILVKNPRSSKLYFLGGRFLTALFNLLYGTKISDLNTGYKIFKKGILEKLNLKEKRFSFCEETTAKVIRRGYRVKEVPIHYAPRSFQEGKKIRWWRDGLFGLSAIIKYRFF